MHTIDVDLVLLQRTSGLLLPLLVALVTKKVSSNGLRATLNVLLAAVSAVVGVALKYDGAGIPVTMLMESFSTTIITSVAMYHGLWKPTGIADTVVEKTANFGIGPVPELETEDVGATEEGDKKAEKLAD